MTTSLVSRLIDELKIKEDFAVVVSDGEVTHTKDMIHSVNDSIRCFYVTINNLGIIFFFVAISNLVLAKRRTFRSAIQLISHPVFCST